jgi:predicted ester cyclase
MSTQENKATIYRLAEERNKGNLNVIDECFAENFIRYGQGVPNMDREGYKRFCFMILKGYPDIRFNIDDMVAEGDKVAFRWTMTGTNTGEFLGKPPTGEHITYTEDYFVRFVQGKIVEFSNLAAIPSN